MYQRSEKKPLQEAPEQKPEQKSHNARAKKVLSHRSGSYEPKELLRQSEKQIFHVYVGQAKPDLIHLF